MVSLEPYKHVKRFEMRSSARQATAAHGGTVTRENSRERKADHFSPPSGESLEVAIEVSLQRG